MNSAVFSPDGKHIVTGRPTGPRVSGTPQRQKRSPSCRGHEDKVNSAVFSPDGKRIVTGSSDKTARVWDTATANEIAVLQRP